MTPESEDTITVRLSWPWQLIAPTLLGLPLAFPFLVHYVELRALTRDDIAPPALVAAFGIAYLWYCTHSARVGPVGVEFRCLAGRRWLAWSDVAAYEVTDNWVVAADRTGRKYRVSIYSRGAELLAEKLREAVQGRTNR
jgi:hypothetical protein